MENKTIKNRNSVISILGCMFAVLVFLLLMVFFVPGVEVTLQDIDVFSFLPFLVRLPYKVSHICSSYWWTILIFFLMMIFTLEKMVRNKVLLDKIYRVLIYAILGVLLFLVSQLFLPFETLIMKGS